MSTKKNTQSISNRTTVEGSVYGASTNSSLKTTWSNRRADQRPIGRPVETQQEKFILGNPTYGYNQKSTTTSQWESTIGRVLPLVQADRESALQSLKNYRQRYYKNQRRSTRKNRKNRSATRRNHK